MQKYFLTILGFFTITAYGNINFFIDVSLNFMLSRALYVAADLSIADILKKESCDLVELARRTGAHPASLERLMRLLEHKNIFVRDQDGIYHITDLAEYMTVDHPKSMRGLILHEDATRWNCYGNLGYSITTGNPVFDELYGMSYFAYIGNNDLLKQRFNEAMTTISDSEEEIISKEYPFGQYGVIADIGGGRGGMISHILSNHRNIKVILADLPDVIKDHALLDKFPDCVTVQEANFFEPLAVQADLFILKRVLHDWDDARVVEILKNIAQTMAPSNRLVIIEGLIGQEGEQKALLAAVDLILLSVFGGRERTLEEFESLIQAAGLEILDVVKTSSMLSIIECAPAIKKENAPIIIS